MNSLDTNILVYAANADAPEHQKAMEVVSSMLANPGKWILADQVLFEFYRAIRNPRILQYPLSASNAAERLHFLRNDTGLRFCWYESKVFPAVLRQVGQPGFPYQRTHDRILACTLIANGVETFYTRNQKDLVGFAKETFQQGQTALAREVKEQGQTLYTKKVRLLKHDRPSPTTSLGSTLTPI